MHARNACIFGLPLRPNWPKTSIPTGSHICKQGKEAVSPDPGKSTTNSLSLHSSLTKAHPPGYLSHLCDALLGFPIPSAAVLETDLARLTETESNGSFYSELYVAESKLFLWTGAKNPVQIRSYYVDWKMLRDVKRRQMAFEYADERLRINALRKNTILPKELQDVADKEIAAMPRDSCPVRIRNRCVLTSRPRGVRKRWRLSRIVFRHLTDHNQMSGIQRAIW
uniref:28S ribosomal protein S14, mitochondrial n=1 Tax=Geotrypetes seraphini TaxID=260995 RepID=A0A6P8NNJ4_GEOSA|nr:28S ribosomal protein S14, mitochondrial [Geotrypetes seraphini]